MNHEGQQEVTEEFRDLQRKAFTEQAEKLLAEWRANLQLPKGWTEIKRGVDGSAFRCRRRKLQVIFSLTLELDGKIWAHVSVAHKARIPTYSDLKLVKRVFLGSDCTALQVFPPEKDHVNIHRNCLHLWSSLGESVTPDFTHGTGSV